jgi:hypothetical protein
MSGPFFGLGDRVGRSGAFSGVKIGQKAPLQRRWDGLKIARSPEENKSLKGPPS